MYCPCVGTRLGAADDCYPFIHGFVDFYRNLTLSLKAKRTAILSTYDSVRRFGSSNATVLTEHLSVLDTHLAIDFLDKYGKLRFKRGRPMLTGRYSFPLFQRFGDVAAN